MNSGGYGGDDSTSTPVRQPQFVGGDSRAIVVRNTFLDIEDGSAPSQDDLRRSRTAPAGGAPAGGQEESDDSDDQEDGEGVQGVPEMTNVMRQVTTDWVEDPKEWAWANDADGSPPSQQFVQPQQPSPGGVPNWSAVPMLGAGQAVAPPAPMMGCYMDASGMVFAPMLVPLAPDPSSGMLPQMQALNQPMLPVVPDRTARWPPSSVAAVQPGLPAQSSAQADASAPSLGGDSATAASADGPPQPQTLTRQFSVSSGFFRVHWTVDARKLRGNDKQAVSPPFEMSFGADFPDVTFKMMIYPKVVNDSKGGASFKKAKGKGYIQLKCEAELNEAIACVKFRLSIGNEDPRGPVTHNFSQSAVCGLDKEKDEWDFGGVVAQDSQTFVVCLEIVPHR